MGCRKSTELRLNKMLIDAEKQRICYVPDNSCDLRALSRFVESGEALRPFRSMYVRTSFWMQLSGPQRAKFIIRTLARMHPQWVFSHSSAAVIHNLEVPNAALSPIHYFGAISSNGTSQDRVQCHRSSDYIGQLKDEVLVTSVDQTVVDCASQYPFCQALPIADSALHLGLTSKDRLNACLVDRKNRRGTRKALRVLELADSRPDNGGESYIRALMIENNLPKPELQAPIRNPEKPNHFYYADFLFTREDGVQVDMELDGMGKYTDENMTGGKKRLDVLMAERQREASITSWGIQVVRFGYKQARNPRILLNRLGLYGIEPIV